MEQDALPTPPVGRDPVPLTVAGHAGTGAPGRSLHAQYALGAERAIRADDRLARPGSRRDHAHTRRTERPPLVAVLPELAPGVGQWGADAADARKTRALAHLPALIATPSPSGIEPHRNALFTAGT